MENNLNIGDLVQLENGKIGMIINIHPSNLHKSSPNYEVEWYHSMLHPVIISEYDVMKMHSRYLNFRDWVYESSNR